MAEAGGYDFGAAWLTIIPSLRAAQTKVKKEASEWGREAGQNFQRSFDAEVRKPSRAEPGPSKAASAKQGSDSGGAFADSFRKRVQAAARSLPPMRITAATSEAEQKLRDLRTDLDALSGQTVGVDIDSASATAELDRIRADLARLGADSPDVRVRADTAAVGAQLDVLAAQVSALDGRDVDVQVDADTGGANAGLGAVAAQASALDGKDVDIRVDVNDFGSLNRFTGRLVALGLAGVALGPAIVPIGGAIIASLAGIAPAAVAGVAGLGVLGIAFAGVGDAVGALGDQQRDAASDAEAAAATQRTAAEGVASAARQSEAAETGLASARANAAAGAEKAAARVEDAQEGVARAEADAGQAAEESARQVQDARRGVVEATQEATRGIAQALEAQEDAQQGVVDAQAAATDQIEAALRRQADAERSVTSAQRDTRQSVLDLTQSRRDAADQIEDLRLASEGSALGVEDAQLSLERAKIRKSDVDSSVASNKVDFQDVGRAEWDRLMAQGWKGRNDGTDDRIYAPKGQRRTPWTLETREADLGVRQAELRLKEARERNKDVREEAAAARKAGVEGSDLVVDAKGRLLAAQTAETDAERAAGDATREVADARVEGTRRVTEAQEVASDAAAALDQARIDGTARVADAERGLADARREATQSAADGQVRIADAQAAVTDALTAQDEQQRQSAESIEGALRQVESAQAASITAALALADAQDATTTSMDKVDEAMSKLGPKGQAFALFLFGLRDEWMLLKSAAEGGFLPGLQAGITALMPSLPGFIGFISQLSGVLGDLSERAGEALAGPKWDPFFSMMNRIGGTTLDLLVTGLGNFALALANLMVAFEPVSIRFIEGFAGMMESFAAWTAGLSQNQAFQAFLGYIQENIPVVLSFLGSLSGFFVALIRSMAPFGPIVLGIASAFMDFVASLPPGVIAAIVMGIAGLAFVFGPLGAIVMAAAAAIAFFGGPVAAAIGLMVVLGAAMVSAYMHSDTFRVHMTTAMQAVGNVVMWLWENVTKPYLGFMWNLLKAVSAWVRDEGAPQFMLGLRRIGDAATWLWSNAIGPALRFVWGLLRTVFGWLRDTGAPMGMVALRAVGDVAMWLWRNAISPYFGFMLTLWKSVFGWVRNTGWPWLRDAFQFVGEKAGWLWRNAISPYFGFMLNLWKSVFSWLRDTGVPMVRKAMQSVGDKATWLWENMIKPAFKGIKSVISSAWDNVKTSFDNFKTGVGKVASAFSTAASGISTAWNKVKEFVAKPIVAVLGFVNSGIIGGLNKVLDWAGAGKISKITIPAGLYNAAGGNSEGPTSKGNTAGAGRNRAAALAMGGVLPGYSPGVDNMTFTGSAGRLDLSGGEAIMRPEWTRAIGAAGVNAMNALARTGGVRAVRERMGFADGGVLPGGRSSFSVGGIADFVGNVAGGAGDLASGLVAFLKKPVSFLKDMFGKSLSGIASNPLYDFAKGTVGKVASGAKDKLMSMFNLGSTDDASRGGGGGGSYSDRGGSWEKIRGLIQGAGFNPVIRAGGTWRPGWTTKTGFPSRHQLGKALDLLPDRSIQDFLWGIKNQFRELYLPDGRGWLMGKPRSAYPGAATTMNNHMGSNAHIHAAYAQGGQIPDAGFPRVYDQGGILPPGGMGINMSTKPELVLTQDQLARMSGPQTLSLSGVDLTLVVDGRPMAAYVREGATAVLSETARSAVGHGARRGGY